MGGLPVVVLDASAAQRRAVRAALAADGGVVVGEARTCAEALALVARLAPAVLVLDLDLPDGLLTLEAVMAEHPVPVVARTRDPASGAAARAAGAVEVLGTPRLDGAGPSPEQDEQLRAAVRLAARVRVIRHPRSRLRPAPLPRTAPDREDGVRLVALGASTGGPGALLTVLSALAALPAERGVAVLVVQHMGEAFVPGLVDWFAEQLPVPVVLGASGQRLRPGTVTVAPGSGNLVVQDARLRVRCEPAPAGQHHVPGIDAAFTSVAAALGPRAVGVLLTGMGRDGAAGLRAMRDAGAATLGQDEATSAVYGMPAAAQAAGAVQRQLPLPELGPALRALLGGPLGAPAR